MYKIYLHNLAKCSKSATGGTAGDGDGASKGNCDGNDQICYGSGTCDSMYCCNKYFPTNAY